MKSRIANFSCNYKTTLKEKLFFIDRASGKFDIMQLKHHQAMVSWCSR